MTAGRDPTPDEPGPGPSISPPQRPSQISTAEAAEALNVARRLAEAGVPIFVARPNPARPIGFTFPDRWQHTTPDPAVVDSWRPGWALCMVTGHGLDLIDVDPRNGGTLAALDGFCPDSYGEQDTPSGGEHLLVKSLGVGSRDGVLPGIDVKAGTDGGGDHGFLFIAPTVRRSKVTGEVVAYRWRRPPDLDALAEEGPDDTTGAALAELVRQARGEGAGRPAVPPSSPFVKPGDTYAPSPWDDIEGTLAAGRYRGVFKLAAALRGRGGWRADDALRYMDACVWPLIDQEQSGHPFTRAEFLAPLADVFTRYLDGHSDGDDSDAGLVLRPASEIKIAAVDWLWPGRIPRGLLTLLVGRPGLGKTTLMIEVAARVSRGWNGQPPAVVLICTVEDSPAHTLVPRLVAAGADLSKVHFVSIRRDGGEGGITIPDDLAAVEEAIVSTGAVLVVIDPIAGHLSATIGHGAIRWRRATPMVHKADPVRTLG